MYMAILVQPRSQAPLSFFLEKGPWLRLVICAQNLGASQNLLLGRGSKVSSCRFLINSREASCKFVTTSGFITKYFHTHHELESWKIFKFFFHSGGVLLIGKNCFKNCHFGTPGGSRQTMADS